MTHDEEVIRIWIDRVDERGMARWTAMYGQKHSGDWRFRILDLEPGDELVVGARPLLATWVPTRVVNASGRTVVDVGPVDEEMWTPETDRRPADPIVPGELITEVFAFSAASGSDRTSKKRPCLVMEVRETEVRVHPIRSTGSSLHRTGGGLKLLEWNQANLANNSVVWAFDQFCSADDPMNPARRIGRLSNRNLIRVFGHHRSGVPADSADRA